MSTTWYSTLNSSAIAMTLTQYNWGPYLATNANLGAASGQYVTGFTGPVAPITVNNGGSLQFPPGTVTWIGRLSAADFSALGLTIPAGSASGDVFIVGPVVRSQGGVTGGPGTPDAPPQPPLPVPISSADAADLQSFYTQGYAAGQAFVSPAVPPGTTVTEQAAWVAGHFDGSNYPNPLYPARTIQLGGGTGGGRHHGGGGGYGGGHNSGLDTVLTSVLPELIRTGLEGQAGASESGTLQSAQASADSAQASAQSAAVSVQQVQQAQQQAQQQQAAQQQAAQQKPAAAPASKLPLYLGLSALGVVGAAALAWALFRKKTPPPPPVINQGRETSPS